MASATSSPKRDRVRSARSTELKANSNPFTDLTGPRIDAGTKPPEPVTLALSD